MVKNFIGYHNYIPLMEFRIVYTFITFAIVFIIRKFLYATYID